MSQYDGNGSGANGEDLADNCNYSPDSEIADGLRRLQQPASRLQITEEALLRAEQARRRRRRGAEAKAAKARIPEYRNTIDSLRAQLGSPEVDWTKHRLGEPLHLSLKIAKQDPRPVTKKKSPKLNKKRRKMMQV